MSVRKYVYLAVTAISVVVVLAVAGAASAANPPFSCGATITSGTFTLIGNLDCTGYSGTALTVDAGRGQDGDAQSRQVHDHGPQRRLT